MAPRKYRKFDDDFKLIAVRPAFKTGTPIAQVARKSGVNDGTVGNWVARARQQRDGEGPWLGESERTALDRLRKSKTELRLHRDVLKRSAALWVEEAMAGERGHLHRCSEGRP